MSAVDPLSGKKGQTPLEKQEASQCCHKLLFALSIIVSLAATLVGILGIYKITFFGGIGSHVSQGLAYGGGSLLASTALLYMVRLCTYQEPPVLIPIPEPKIEQVSQVPENPIHPASAAAPAHPVMVFLEELPEPIIPPPKLTWKSLIILNERRARSILDDVKAKVGQPEIIPPYGSAKTHYTQKMQGVYKELLQSPLSLNDLPKARQFVKEYLETCNKDFPDKFKIDIPAFFAPFAELESTFTPEYYQKRFLSDLISDVKSLFSGDEVYGLTIDQIKEIDLYIEDQIARYNQQKGALKINSQEIKELALLKYHLNQWREFEAIIAFTGKIDDKIAKLSKLATDLPEPDSSLWDDYPLIKTLMIQPLGVLCASFYEGHAIIETNDDDQLRGAMIDNSIDEIARKLRVAAPDLKISEAVRKSPLEWQWEKILEDAHGNVQEAKRIALFNNIPIPHQME